MQKKSDHQPAAFMIKFLTAISTGGRETVAEHSLVFSLGTLEAFFLETGLVIWLVKIDKSGSINDSERRMLPSLVKSILVWASETFKSVQ
jgi:hypothetical protein